MWSRIFGEGSNVIRTGYDYSEAERERKQRRDKRCCRNKLHIIQYEYSQCGDEECGVQQLCRQKQKCLVHIEKTSTTEIISFVICDSLFVEALLMIELIFYFYFYVITIIDSYLKRPTQLHMYLLNYSLQLRMYQARLILFQGKTSVVTNLCPSSELNFLFLK